jgi:hypothetical protein
MFIIGVDGENAALEAIINGTNYAATGLNNSDHRRGVRPDVHPRDRKGCLPSPLITRTTSCNAHPQPGGTF